MEAKLKAVLDRVHFTPKPRKIEALNLLRRAIQGEDLHVYDWAQLMRYFTPAPPKTPKTLRDWLASATNPEDLRQFCHVIHRLPGGALMATDGHRLHLATADHLDTADIPLGDIISPMSWRAIHDRPEYEPPLQLEELVMQRLAAAEPPVDLPPVKDWPETADPNARLIPGTDVAMRVAYAQAARPVQYLGVGDGVGFPGSALFSTPWGHAIIMPCHFN